MDINKAFPILLQQEGISAVCVSGDKGGLTKYGISQAAYPKLDIKNLTMAQALDIYNSDYWLPARCAELKQELQYAHFSASVNCGVGSAARILQRACHVEDDGVIGNDTLKAQLNITLHDYCVEWGLHYKDIEEKHPEDMKFAKGWANRIDNIIQWYKDGKLA